MTTDVRPVIKRSRASRIRSSVFVSTLDVASSRIRNFGSSREGTREADELALADGKSPTALVDRGVYSLRKRSNKWPESDFFQCALDCGAADRFGSELDVGFQRARKEERVLQHDTEQRAQILQGDLADIHTVEQDLAALDIVEAQKKLNDRGLARAGVADDGERLTRLDAEGNVAQHPVFIFGRRAAVIREPDVAEFDFTARSGERVRIADQEPE